MARQYVIIFAIIVIILIMIIKIMFTHGWQVEIRLRHYRHLLVHDVGLHSRQERREL